MSLAIKWGNFDNPEEESGFIYIDAVTDFTQDHRGTVTKHPIDSGASVTDHFVKENAVYTISGIISGVDLSAIPDSITDQEGNKPINAKWQVQPVSISNVGSNLLQYLPASASQFLNKSQPEITVDAAVRTDLTYEVLVKDLLKGLMKGNKWSDQKQRFVSDIKLVELYEFDGSVIRNITSDLVITSFRVRENADTGDALFLDLMLEEVTFATLESVLIPEDVVAAVKKKASSDKKKSKAASTPKSCTTAQAEGDTTAPQTTSFQLGSVLSEGSL